MMLPAEMRFTLVFAQFAREQAEAGAGLVARIGAFLGGYLVSWTVFGCLAWSFDRLLRRLAPEALAWEAYGAVVAGALIAAAGLYQISALKQACLRHCISPLGFFMQRWRPGAAGAVRMGVEHAIYCIGCCWALMLVLFAVGVMSLFWMSLLAVVMFAEKILPSGPRLGRPIAVALVLLGLWVAWAPASVPFLTMPGAPGAQHIH
jgi:predicted metal-binding membrane protein